MAEASPSGSATALPTPATWPAGRSRRCPGWRTSMRAGWSTGTSNPPTSWSANCGAPRIRIADFGIATPAGVELEPGDSSGTVHYMSPEQAAGRHSGAPGDIYSLGLVLLECLTGAKAFPGTPVESLVARTLRDPEIPAGIGASWVSLLTASDRSGSRGPSFGRCGRQARGKASAPFLSAAGSLNSGQLSLLGCPPR